jgi:hypothetical protein
MKLAKFTLMASAYPRTQSSNPHLVSAHVTEWTFTLITRSEINIVNTQLMLNILATAASRRKRRPRSV